MACKNCTCPECAQAHKENMEFLWGKAEKLYKLNKPAAADALDRMLQTGEIPREYEQEFYLVLEEYAYKKHDVAFSQDVQEIYYHYHGNK